jgi:8-amino-7-oxononanoate synthase
MPRMSVDSPLEHRIRQRLADLDAAGLRRSLQVPGGIDLCSNDYLGLARHPRLISRFAEGVRREGGGSTGSRLLRGERDCFRAVEERFARFKGTERALYFGSGYLANLAVLTTLAEASDVILSDERNHASLIDGARLSPARKIVFPHNDPRALAERLADTGSAGVRFVVVESLFSMDGDMAPLADYADVCRQARAVLVVDEAHAVGVYGPSGSGLLETQDWNSADANTPEAYSPVCVSINTAGKALGVSGAFVAGPAWAIEYLVQAARSFVFSTAPPPALAVALDASLDLVRDEPERRDQLVRFSTYLRERLRDSGVDVPSGVSHIVPVIVGDNEHAVAIARVMQLEGFDVRAIRPPSVPAGTARLRLSVNVNLTEATIDRLVAILAAALKESGLCSAVSS